MKTTLILFASFFVATAAFSQSDRQRNESRREVFGAPGSYHDNDRDIVYGGGNGRGYSEPDPRYRATREQRVYEINREYDAQIYSVRNDRFLSRRERERTIRGLEMERSRQLDAVNEGYYRTDRHYDNGRGHDWDRGNDNSHSRY